MASILEKYSLSELTQKYDDFIQLISTSFSGKRKARLLEMYSDQNLGRELIVAPASSVLHFHNCYVGGYIDHINNVIKNSRIAAKFMASAGCTIDFTDEELLFAAIHHDLGKLGDDTGPYYVIQESEWHQRVKGEYFILNPKIQWMTTTDRGMYMLSKFEISMTWKELLAIRLADGLYDPTNLDYLKGFSFHKGLKTELPNVLHTGDFISCKGEHDTLIREHPSLFS